MLIASASNPANGADPVKLQRQIAQYGSSTRGIPPILVYRSSDGALIIFDGVTRASRMAKLKPGILVSVEVIVRELIAKHYGKRNSPELIDFTIGRL